MTVNQYPAVMKTTLCQEYVGGKPEWDELEAVYGDTHLRPLRTTGTNQSYLKETIDKVLRMAESEGKLNDRPLVATAMERRKLQRTALKSQP